MMNESNNLPDLPSNSKKKSYSAMKVSRLGSLSDLTQRRNVGAYGDATQMQMEAPGVND
jgi:hypothetical protein